MERGKARKTSAGSTRQNLTVQLDRETIRKAKVVAAQQGTSVSKLVERTIHGLVDGAERYEAAKRRALSHLASGFHLGGEVRTSRDELHER